MPIYEYRCDQGHIFEVVRRMTDEPLSACLTCSAPVEQVFHPIAVHFKGKGFYNTDYGTKKRAREMQESKGEGAKSEAKPAESASSDSASSDSGSSDSKSSDSKTSEARSSESKSTPTKAEGSATEKKKAPPAKSGQSSE